MSDFTCATSDQAPPGASVATRPPEPRLAVRVDRLRAEMAQLGLDESKLALWGRMTPALVHAVLVTGQANRATLRRLKTGIRFAWTDKVGVAGDADREHWSRVTMRYLSDDLA